MFYHGWTTDLNEFFKDKTYVLNTSPRESQCMSVMEGMAAGLKPLVYDWVGADKLYGEHVWKTVTEFRKMLNTSYNPERYRKVIKDNYSSVILNRRVKNLIEEFL